MAPIHIYISKDAPTNKPKFERPTTNSHIANSTKNVNSAILEKSHAGGKRGAFPPRRENRSFSRQVVFRGGKFARVSIVSFMVQIHSPFVLMSKCVHCIGWQGKTAFGYNRIAMSFCLLWFELMMSENYVLLYQWWWIVFVVKFLGIFYRQGVSG